jgi:hypothetical protein
MIAVVVVLIAVVCAGVAAFIATAKGRSVSGFALAGLLLGPVGLLWALFAFPASELERSEIEKDRRADLAARLQRRIGWPRG